MKWKQKRKPHLGCNRAGLKIAINYVNRAFVILTHLSPRASIFWLLPPVLAVLQKGETK